MKEMFYGAIKLIFQRAAELRKHPTPEEQILWQYLKAKKLGVRFKRQHPMVKYIADFYSHEIRLVIEVDGPIHDNKEVLENDRVREKDICSLGITLIRFTNFEIRNDITNVIETIRNLINKLKENGDRKEKSY